jgi:uncharacterized protein (TIGR03437 family)
MVFTPGDLYLPNTGVRNAASIDVFAVGSVTLSGTIKADDEVTVKIVDKEYKHKIVANDTFDSVINALVTLINAGEGDPNVFATPNTVFATLILTARKPGEEGNSIAYSTSTSTSAQIALTTAGANLAGGQDATKIAPGTLVTLIGENFTSNTASLPQNADVAAFELGGVQVYFDGMRAPLFMVSPTKINAQVPFEFTDTTSVTAWVRSKQSDGSIKITNAIAVPIIGQNPGLFAETGSDPRPGIVMHGSSYASASISVDGAIKENDVASVIIEDRKYSYTVTAGSSLQSIRDGLINAINEANDKVVASAGGQFQRIRLRARVAGPEGNGIPLAVETSTDAQVILSPSGTALCCANTAGERVTDDNPAVPGETVVLYGTGLGIIKPEEAKWTVTAGFKYSGPELNEPVEFVYALAGGKTANVLFSGLRPGSIGLYELQLELNSDIPTNPKTQLTIAQSFQVSNIVTFPVVNNNPPAQ